MVSIAQDAVGSGHLLIAGGALDPRHREVYQALLDKVPGDRPVGIVPLASGVPEESGPLSVEDFRQYSVNPDKVFDTLLTNNDPTAVATPEAAALIAKCGGLWFTGGDQSRIVAAMRPDSGDTLAYEKVLELLAAGGVVGGSSAGAAMMSNPMLRSGESEEAMLLGMTSELDGPGVCVGKGMGLFPYGLTDQHFLQRGRFGRLLVAMEATECRFGFGVSENTAMDVDRAKKTLTAIGDQAITIIDRSEGTLLNHARTNVRVHLLNDADVFAIDSSMVQPVGRRIEAATAAEPPSQGRRRRGTKMWDDDVVATMIRSLATDPSMPVTNDDDCFDYQFSADQKTQFFQASGKHGAAVTAINVRLDITPRADIKERIAERRANYKKIDWAE